MGMKFKKDAAKIKAALPKLSDADIRSFLDTGSITVEGKELSAEDLRVQRGLKQSRETANIEVTVEIEPDASLPGLRISALARVSGKTGVEMEALTAASVACLTVYDMAKAIDKTMAIGGVRVIRKSGGKSGNWSA